MTKVAGDDQDKTVGMEVFTTRKGLLAIGQLVDQNGWKWLVTRSERDCL